MGMVKCKECGKEISSKAEFCPSCGAKRNNKPFFSVKGFIVLLFLVTMYIVITDNNSNQKVNNTTTKKVLTEQQKHNKEKIIVKNLKKIPSSEIYTNSNMYRELNELFPLNKKYNKKLAYYENKITELEKRIGKYPQVSSWDGVPYAAERYIKSIAKDPDSVEFDGCNKIRFSDDGWVTSCKVRAKNSFGGYVLNVYKFTINHNRVINAENIN